MARVFISYRRSDSKEITEKIYKELVHIFGERNVFRDEQTIQAGTNWRAELIRNVHKYQFMLVIIGPKWLNTVDDNGHRRLDNPLDFVRFEVETGLALDEVKVIPVLVKNARMPAAKTLPGNLRSLADIQAISLRKEPDFEEDVAKLLLILDPYLEDNLSKQIENTSENLSQEISTIVKDKITGFANEVAARVRDIPGTIPKMGLRQIAYQRHGYQGYYTWIVSDKVGLNLFFAGRAVLSRIHADMKVHSLGILEHVIYEKLQNRAKIQILFLDPRSDIIERISKEEGQQAEQFLFDVAASVKLCKQLYEFLVDKELSDKAKIDIRIYDQIPYFAYHRVNEKTFIGFYFATRLGYTSAAFEADDLATKDFFKRHFDHIFTRSDDTILLQYTPTEGLYFNESLYKKLESFLEVKLGRGFEKLGWQMETIDTSHESESEINSRGGLY